MTLFGSGHEIVTSTTRPSTPVTGQLIYETNTNLLMMWNGSNWVMPTSGQNAGGDLTGSYPNPTITNITNAPIHNSNTTLSFRTSSTERMGIDASGRVATPYQPMFWAYGTGYIGRSAGDSAAIVWGSTLYNTGSHYNAGNGRFTAPVSGTYLFSANIRLDGTGAGSYVRYGIRKNGTSAEFASVNGNAHAIQGNYHSTDYNTLPITSIIYLAANDYVWSWCFHIATGGSVLASESNFSGCFLG